jgi:hypothetical protein
MVLPGGPKRAGIAKSENSISLFQRDHGLNEITGKGMAGKNRISPSPVM